MKERLGSGFKIAFLNIVIFVIIFSFFMLAQLNKLTLYSFLFLTGGVFSSSFTFFLFVWLLLSVLGILIPSKRFFQFVGIITATLLTSYLLTDFAIYRIYGFHFNSMVVGMITNKGFWDSVSLGKWTFLTFTAIMGVIVLLEYMLLKFSGKLIFNKKYIVGVILFFVVVTALERVAFAVSDIFNYKDITYFSDTYPLYFPLTMKGFAKKVLKLEINHEKDFKIQKSYLDYPKQDIKLPENISENRKNIIIIVIDSLRFDMITSDIAPNIHEFSKSALNFTNHYSGGNSTRFGIFSMFYGIYGYFWHDFLADRKSPVLVDVLKKAGYEFNILSATSLTFPEFRKTAFINISESVYDTYLVEDISEREKVMVQRFKNFRKNLSDGKPYFSFIFFDAPHARRYPEDFKKFTVKNGETNYLSLGKKDVEDKKNAYKNAIFYNDKLTGDILSFLQKIGDLGNSVVIITSDHGEEFYENGHFGHNNSFSDYQTKVPMVMYIHGFEPKNTNYLTTHYDIVPTIMNILGIKNDVSDYSFGKNMLEDNKREDVIICNWSNCAIKDSKSTLVFSYETHKSFNMELFDKNYKTIEDNDIYSFKKKALAPLAMEFKYFYK